MPLDTNKYIEKKNHSIVIIILITLIVFLSVFYYLSISNYENVIEELKNEKDISKVYYKIALLHIIAPKYKEVGKYFDIAQARYNFKKGMEKELKHPIEAIKYFEKAKNTKFAKTPEAKQIIDDNINWCKMNDLYIIYNNENDFNRKIEFLGQAKEYANLIKDKEIKQHSLNQLNEALKLEKTNKKNREKEIARLKKEIKVYKDEVTNDTFYYDEECAKDFFYSIGSYGENISICPVLSLKGNKHIYFKLRWAGDTPIHFKKLLINIDGNLVMEENVLGKTERDYDELGEVDTNKSFLLKIANANKVIMRLEGKGKEDKVLTETEKHAMLNIAKYYDLVN